MNQLMAGAIIMGYCVAGLFFLRFWKDTRDRLFGIFALAFWMLALNRVALAFIDEANEARSLIYILRLLAFVLILIAILNKNRSAKATH